MDAALKPLLDKAASWLMPGGPDSDVILASRIRWARNVSGMNFPASMPREDAEQFCFDAHSKLENTFVDPIIIDPATIDVGDKLLLMERSIASPKMLSSKYPNLVIFESDESISLMVNEEDHFRLQAYAAGLNFSVANNLGQPAVGRVGHFFRFAESSRLGFLTACPSNVGSGLRASVLAHLPALHFKKDAMSKLANAARRSGFTVRGVHGEGSAALGHMVQISYQVTLGPSHDNQLDKIKKFAQGVVDFERGLRRAFISSPKARMELTRNAKKILADVAASKPISAPLALKRLSVLRFAVMCELGDELNIYSSAHNLLTYFVYVQSGHLQGRGGRLMNKKDRGRARGEMLKRILLLPT